MPRDDARSFADDLRSAVYGDPEADLRSILRSAGLSSLAIEPRPDGSIEAGLPHPHPLTRRLTAAKTAALVVHCSGRFELESSGWFVGIRVRPIPEKSE